MIFPKLTGSTSGYTAKIQSIDLANNYLYVEYVVDDRLDFIVVDKDYLYKGILYPEQYDDGQGTILDWSVAAPNGVELDEFGSDWYVDDSTKTQLDVITPYPARIFSGLYMRIRYHAIGTTNDVKVKVNTYLHKKG